MLDLLGEHREVLCSGDASRGLVHGDCNGRNVLVGGTGAESRWIAGILDWESAFLGGRLWDIGSLFRYSRRYRPDFRDRFVQGYESMGVGLPRDWWLLARLLDSTRLVAILDEDRSLPMVFAECRTLIRELVADTRRFEIPRAHTIPADAGARRRRAGA
jgi:Ser/Thr protein kinase RdoA (MazF antagonist)